MFPKKRINNRGIFSLKTFLVIILIILIALLFYYNYKNDSVNDEEINLNEAEIEVPYFDEEEVHLEEGAPADFEEKTPLSE